MGKYDDIIDLPHHISKTRQQMSMEARAAQFAPFAALTGYEEQVIETGRLTDERIELSDEEISILDEKLQKVRGQILSRQPISFTYFIPDNRKSGGKYVTTAGIVKKVDEYKQSIILEDTTQIPIMEIIDISLV